jgi:hypothetical protein
VTGLPLGCIGAEQRAVQFGEVFGVSDAFSVFSRHGIRIRLVFDHLPLTGTSNYP